MDGHTLADCSDCSISPAMQHVLLLPATRKALSKDRCACVECCLDACLCDGDGLLFHGLMDGCLVMLVHLIKLVNTSHTLEGEGEGVHRYKMDTHSDLKIFEHVHVFYKSLTG